LQDSLNFVRLGDCSADGAEWFTVGGVEFPVEDPVEVGLHVILRYAQDKHRPHHLSLRFPGGDGDSVRVFPVVRDVVRRFEGW
jgi:hypothetical protein